MSQDRFEDLTRAIAQTTSRRQTVKTLTAGIAGGVLAMLAPKQTGAAPPPKSCCAYFCTTTGGAVSIKTRCVTGVIEPVECPALKGCQPCGLARTLTNCADNCRAAVDFCIVG